jgi:hypothetical protein
MGIWESILSGGVGSIFSGIGSLAKDIREAVTGEAIVDPQKKLEVEAKLMELDFLITKAQTDINQAEARNPNLFVSGWRPAVGWCCAMALFWQFIGSPMFEWGCKMAGKVIEAPILDTSALMTILMAMLGMGGMRTYEKIKSAQKNH